jgi:hypothetical protein
VRNSKRWVPGSTHGKGIKSRAKNLFFEVSIRGPSPFHPNWTQNSRVSLDAKDSELKPFFIGGKFGGF